MNWKNTLVPLVALALVSVARPAASLDWSDNSFHVSWGGNYHEPGTVKPGTDEAQAIAKTTLTYTHASGDKLGGNFLNVDMYISDKHDPAQGSAQGATEVYAVYRRTFSLNQITDSKKFAFPGVADVRLDAGLDIGTKNNGFASHKVMPVAGVSLALAVPGFWNIGAYVSKEWNNNGFMHAQGTIPSGGSVEFDVAPVFSTAWGVPLFDLPLQFAGFANVLLPKGKDGFGNETKTEVLLQPKLVWDVAKTFSSTRTGYEVGVGYQYWLNKYGNDNDLTVGGVKVNAGALSSTVFVEAAIHL
ncbi:hypothetical protein [Anaeromyxobacter oryzae]|uniref:Uncharacterized protein n=1 Tax=Anaeromyxobacter oryzae TaxID=2918170 RepID=A0ABM7WSS8_9BACT|nr:hypothetical protein [Anaeromyxobacter oryzae]BDG02475.1 hypothetical protein AMOR_14710 [Anaeromyxobacter oryzae]